MFIPRVHLLAVTLHFRYTQYTRLCKRLGKSTAVSALQKHAKQLKQKCSQPTATDALFKKLQLETTNLPGGEDYRALFLYQSRDTPQSKGRLLT